MKYLLDTNIFLWSLEDDIKLSKEFKHIITNPKNSIFVSVCSAWEIEIKFALKKLPLKTSPNILFKNLDFEILPILLKHVQEVSKLPLHHKDPFDRLLIAQAKSEKLRLLTSDQKILNYFKN